MKTSELRNIVDMLKPAFKLNDLAEFGKYIIFQTDKVFVYNGAMAIVVEHTTDKEFALPADEFTKFISRVKSKDVEITIGDTIEIKAGNAKASFAKNDDIVTRAKALKIIIPTQLERIPDDFCKGLKMCQYSIGKDKSYEHLTYLNIEGKLMASTDNLRVSEYVLSDDVTDMMIPREAVKYLIQYDVKEYSIELGFAYFKNKDNVWFITRIGDMLFPDYATFLEGEGQDITLPDDISDIVATAAVTVDDIANIENTVNVNIENNKVTVSSQNDVGKIVVESDVEYKDKASFSISPAFFDDILKITKNIRVCENKILFKVDNFRHVVALLN